MLLVFSFLLALIGCGANNTQGTNEDQTGNSAASTGQNTADDTSSAGDAADVTPDVKDIAWPEEDIIFDTSWSAGSSGDLSARLLFQYLEPMLDVTITPVIAKENIAQGEMMKKGAEGYSFTNLNIPNVYKHYDPANNNSMVPYTEYALLCNLFTDPNVIAVRTDDERFTDVNDLKDFVEYCKTNDADLLVGVNTAGGDDDIALYKLRAACDLVDNLTHVNNSNVASNKSSFLGGHIDAYIGNVSDCSTMITDGTAKVLAVFWNERSVFMSDVPTAQELGYDLSAAACRGIGMHPDTDPAIIEKFVACIEEALSNPDLIAALGAQGCQIDFKGPEEFEQLLAEQDEIMRNEVIELAGWK